MSNKKEPLHVKPKIDVECCIYEGAIEHIPLHIYLTSGNEDDADSSLFDDKIEMNVGINCSFKDVIESVVHELDELYLLLKGARYYDSHKDSRFESIECVFMFNHTTLQIKDFVISDILVDVFIPILKEWQKYHIKHKTQYYAAIMKNKKNKKNK